LSQELKPKPLFLAVLALLAVLGLVIVGTASADSKDNGKNDVKVVKVEDNNKNDDNGHDDHVINCDGDNSGPYRDVCPDDKQDDDHDGKKHDDDDDKPVVIYPKPDDNGPPVVVENNDVDVDITVNNTVVHVVENTTINNVVNFINNGTIVINVNSNNGNTVTMVSAPRETPRSLPRRTAACPTNAIHKLTVFTRSSNLHNIKVMVDGRMVKEQNGHGRNSARIFFRPGATPFKIRIIARVESERTGMMSTFRSRLKTVNHCRTVHIDP
jgi:septal ring-binding cell division protein DamX